MYKSLQKMILLTLIFISSNFSQSQSAVEWFAMSGGMSTTVDAVAVIGNDVYVGGLFTFAGGIQVNRIAKWNGTNWSSLGGGVNGQVTSLAVIGNDVYAAGNFSIAGGVPVNNIAKWDGVSWSALGEGLNELVLSLAVSGTDLYAGGFFTQAGGVAANHIAKWDGTSWSALGEGINNEVDAIAVDGNNVYAGGYFNVAGRKDVRSIAVWNGFDWNPMGEGIFGIVRSLIVKNGIVYAGGIFETAGSETVNRIAKWDGVNWSALGTGLGGSVFSMTSFGDDIYVGGLFTTAGGNTANRIAKYNISSSTWSALGTGLSGSVDAMAVQTNTGSMIIGGSFGQTVSGLTLNYIGRFTDSDNQLPVELISFEANVHHNKVTLNWRTSSEQNNRGFEVERREVGDRQLAVGNEEWNVIGFVNGSGTTTQTQTYSFIDEVITPGKYQYRLKQIDFDGSYEYSNIVEGSFIKPNVFSLEQNYPNPFNPTTTIKYAVGDTYYASPVLLTLRVYDILGNEIATLVNEEKSAGTYEVNFDAADFPSGIYFYKLQSGSYVGTRKMMLLK